MIDYVSASFPTATQVATLLLSFSDQVIADGVKVRRAVRRDSVRKRTWYLASLSHPKAGRRALIVADNWINRGGAFPQNQDAQ